MSDAATAALQGSDTPPPTAESERGRREHLREAIEHAIHYLPTQGPISIFVHHNTLHSFEDLPFDQAVLAGLRRYGGEPYLSESRYREELQRGRISMEDLRQVLMDDLGDDADELIASFGTRYTLRLAMLQTALHSVPQAELQWLLAETDMLKRFRSEVSAERRDYAIEQTRTWLVRGIENITPSPAHERQTDSGRPLPESVLSLINETRIDKLQSWSNQKWESVVLQSLWQICRSGVQSADALTKQPSDHHRWSTIRTRDLLKKVAGEDIDAMVNDVLIRFCGVYLDQGFADWQLPDREQGFAFAFASLYSTSFAVVPGWMQGISTELKAFAEATFDPLTSIAQSLQLLGVDSASVEDLICETAMALRGWAGMIWQMESNTPFLLKPVPSGSFDEYLAIRLLLERYAIAAVGDRRFGTRDLAQIRVLALQASPPPSGSSIDERTYTIFQLAQIGGWTPEQLARMTDRQWACLVHETEQFSSLQRRRILHAAYERHYWVATFDALTIHTKRRQSMASAATHKPSFVAIFCIDDREESFRRHLEEVDPHCQTASAAGFFAVAMYYQGSDHANFRPLCPAIIRPKHFVREEPVFSAIDANERRADRRRWIGRLRHGVHAHSRTLIGDWFTGMFGAVATFPMVARIMAPRLTARIRRSIGSFVKPPPTELHIERQSIEPGSDPQSLGYSVDEMASIVIRILQDIGMVEDFPPILVFFGHGSGSLNNPHESAYSCGACSGGRGGPNARAFAMMANDPRVRRLMAQRGVVLPQDVWFIGGYHNTCNDHVEYYDLDLLPRSHRPLFREIEHRIHLTRARNAQERSRRFESASLDLTPREALEHVEERAEDLSQARPEYNHATNALVVVGRRSWTRGLFMDRRVFLTEYDPAVDDENVSVLTRILQAAIPVCAGISLEYYFSTVDNECYGCGSKLPHNVASMIGVMTGAASDLRPGLSQQMIEIHEPMRILFIIETTPEQMNKIIDQNPGIATLVQGNWVELAVIDPNTSTILRYAGGTYQRHIPESYDLPEVQSSMDWYRGQRGHLGFASIVEHPRP